MEKNWHFYEALEISDSDLFKVQTATKSYD